MPLELDETSEVVLTGVCWHWTAEVWMAGPGNWVLSVLWDYRQTRERATLDKLMA